MEAHLKSQLITPGGRGGKWDVTKTMAVSSHLVRAPLLAAGDTPRNGNAPLNARAFPATLTKGAKSWKRSLARSGYAFM